MEGVGVGGGVARRPPRPRQPLLDLRQQPHHDRRAARASRSPRTSRRASSATAGTCCASATRTTSSASSTRSTCSGRRRTGPTLIIVDSHIGYGSPHKQDTAAAHGEPLGDDEIRLTKRAYGWPEDAKFLVPDGVREHFAAGHRRARRGGAPASGPRSSPAYRAKYPGARRRARPDAAARAARRLGPEPAGLPRRREGHRRPRRVGQGAERARAERPLAPRRLGRPGPVDQDRAHLRRRGRLPGRRRRAAEPPLRHPRARDGRDRERPVALEAAAVRRDVLHLQRLRAPRDPPVGAHGDADDLRLHARLDRRRRGRPDAPADRAAGVAARDPGPRRRCGPATRTRWSRRTAT